MYSQTILSNKIKLITVPIKNIDIVTVLFLFPIGSRHESKNLHGGSHFIEHMMFKGTEKRPNSLAISKELDKIGAYFNAFTGKDHTGYFVKTVNKKTELTIDVLSDMVFNSVFEKQEFEREKGVIIEEIKMYQENPLLFYEDFFEQNFYQDNSLSRFISGEINDIRKMDLTEILNYRDRFYQPGQMIIAVAGGVKTKEIKKIIEKYLNFKKDKKTGNIKELSLPAKKNKTLKSQVNILFKKELSQTQIALGGIGFSYTHPKLNALKILSIILGGNMSSRLFLEIREKRGLAYSISMQNHSYQDIGHYLISAGIDKDKAVETIKVIIDELLKIKEKGITISELKMAKDYLIGSTKLGLEDSFKYAYGYGKQLLLTGKIKSFDQQLVDLKKVTKKEVDSLAKEVFNNFSLSLIGPFKDKAVFLRILKNGI